MTMNAEQIAQIVAATIATMNNPGATIQPAAHQPPSAEVQEAMLQRNASLQTDAKALVTQLQATNLSEFDPVVLYRMAIAIVTQAARGYMFARKFAEFNASKLDQMISDGIGMGHAVASEVDRVTFEDLEIRVAEQTATMEQNELLVHMGIHWMNALERKASPAQIEAMAGAKDFTKFRTYSDISEQAYQAFLQKSEEDRARKRIQEMNTSRSAHSVIHRTQRNFNPNGK